MGREYKYTIDDINKLTMYQALVLSGAWSPECGRPKDYFEHRSNQRVKL